MEQEQILVQIFQEYQTQEFTAVVVEVVMDQELLQTMGLEQVVQVVEEMVVEDREVMVELELQTLAVVEAAVVK